MTRCAMCSSTAPVDYGLLCAACRAEDSNRLIDDVCSCVQCREGLTHIMPCSKEGGDGHD